MLGLTIIIRIRRRRRRRLKIYVAQLSIKNDLSLPIKELKLTAGFNVFSKKRAASNSSCFRARVLEKRQIDTLLNYFIVAGVINFSNTEAHQQMY